MCARAKCAVAWHLRIRPGWRSRRQRPERTELTMGITIIQNSLPRFIRDASNRRPCFEPEHAARVVSKCFACNAQRLFGKLGRTVLLDGERIIRSHHQPLLADLRPEKVERGAVIENSIVIERLCDFAGIARKQAI